MFVGYMPGPWELGIVVLLVLIVFGAGKLPKVLGQMGKGVKSFKDGMKEAEDDALAGALDATESVAASPVTEAEELRI
jgi:sec-independent protein translocase protein TatA